jgi:acetyl esterase/lipase
MREPATDRPSERRPRKARRVVVGTLGLTAVGVVSMLSSGLLPGGMAGARQHPRGPSRPGPGPGERVEVPLWPGRRRPSMEVFLPRQGGPTPKPAMLVFQGGGYSTPFGSGGGSAEWIAEQGMVGVRVEYRTRATGDAHPSGYADAARAVRLVRQRSAEFGVDPGRIGVLGYSAGGHLASLLSTRPALYSDPVDDLVDQVSARPDLVVLAYPLISFVEGYRPGAFAGSVDNFFGRSTVDEGLRRQFSNELYVDSAHPPVFIWTTRDDALVPYTHAQLFADACRRSNVPVRFELYPRGPHGMGLARDQIGEAREWTGHMLEWLRPQWAL